MSIGNKYDDYAKEAYLKHFFTYLDYKYCIELNRIKPFMDNLNRKWKVIIENRDSIYVSRLELRKDANNFEQLLRNLEGYCNIQDCELLAEDIFLNIRNLTEKYRMSPL